MINNIEKIEKMQNAKVKDINLNTDEMTKIKKSVYRNGVIAGMKESETTRKFVESLSDDLDTSIDMYVEYKLQEDFKEKQLRLEDEMLNKASSLEQEIIDRKAYKIGKDIFINKNYDSIEVGLLDDGEKDTLYKSYLIQEQKKELKKLDDREKIEKLKKMDLEFRAKKLDNNFEENAKKQGVFYKESGDEKMDKFYQTFKVEKTLKFK